MVVKCLNRKCGNYKKKMETEAEGASEVEALRCFDCGELVIPSEGFSTEDKGCPSDLTDGDKIVFERSGGIVAPVEAPIPLEAITYSPGKVTEVPLGLLKKKRMTREGVLEKTRALKDLKETLSTRGEKAVEALMLLYSKQTLEEKGAGRTEEHNGIGFTGHDAEFLTSLAKQQMVRNLSPKQVHCLCKKMPKYAGQLLRLGFKV